MKKVYLSIAWFEANQASTKLIDGYAFNKYLGVHRCTLGGNTWTIVHIPTGRTVRDDITSYWLAVRTVRVIHAMMDWSFTEVDQFGKGQYNNDDVREFFGLKDRKPVDPKTFFTIDKVCRDNGFDSIMQMLQECLDKDLVPCGCFNCGYQEMGIWDEGAAVCPKCGGHGIQSIYVLEGVI